MDKIHLIMNNDYILNETDLILAVSWDNALCDSIYEHKLVIDHENWSLYEVPANYQETPKLIKRVSDIDIRCRGYALYFFVAMSDYCEYCHHDRTKPALIFALERFEDIVNSKWFKEWEIILFLNKVDVFKERIESGISLSICFGEMWQGPDYPDYKYNENMSIVVNRLVTKYENEMNCVIEMHLTKLIINYCSKPIYHNKWVGTSADFWLEICFIQEQFRKVVANPYRKVPIHVLNSTDKDTVKKVHYDTRHTILIGDLTHNAQ